MRSLYFCSNWALWLLAPGAFAAHPQPTLPSQPVSPSLSRLHISRRFLLKGPVLPLGFATLAAPPINHLPTRSWKGAGRGAMAPARVAKQPAQEGWMSENRWQIAKWLQQRTSLCQKPCSGEVPPPPPRSAKHCVIVKSKSKGYCNEHTLPAQLLIVKKLRGGCDHTAYGNRNVIR